MDPNHSLCPVAGLIAQPALPLPPSARGAAAWSLPSAFGGAVAMVIKCYKPFPP